MAVQYNDLTAIGDVIEIRTNTPVMGIQSITGFTDDVLNVTGNRYFTKEYRYSVNGITYNSWRELTDTNLQNTFVNLNDIFDIQYRYTRAGTDTTGVLTFNSIELVGKITEVENPIIYTNLYFNKFFNYNDSGVLNWALNVLNKLYQRGIVSEYLTRNKPEINDDDYIALFGALTHFMAILVKYARVFRDYPDSDILLTEYIRQRGVFVSDGMSLSGLQDVLDRIYVNFFERGTNEIVKAIGVDSRVTDGELLRLIRKSSTDEFMWGLIEKEKTIWNVNNNSPMYRGTKSAVNLVKAYEFEQDVQLLANYPLVESSFVTKYTDGSLEVIRILNSTSSNISGIGGAKAAGKLIIIDPRLSYEITFQAKQVVLGNSLSFKVNLYDSNEDIIADATLNAVTGAASDTAIDKQSLLQNDIFYAIRVILFNVNISDDSSFVPDIGFGNHLIIDSNDAKYMSIELGTEINDGNNDLRIWDFKVRPLMTQYGNGFVMISNIITTFLENNSEDTNQIIENKIKRYLIPYSSTLRLQFLDELFVPTGTPLTIQILFTNETILGANNGTITIVATGGTPTYEYSIDDGSNYQSSGYFDNLSPQTYNIRVKDALGVEVTDTVIIAVGANNLDFNYYVTLASRGDSNDGEIEIIPFGGVPAYGYSIDSGPFLGPNIFTGLLPDTYNIRVQDSSLFIVSKDVVVGAIRNLAITFTVEDDSVPVENAIVTIDQLPLESYLTNSSGEIVIYVEAGNYTYNVEKSDYKSVQESIAVTEDLAIDVQLSRYYDITFNVEDSLGVAIPNTTIETLVVPSGQDPFTIQTPPGSGTIVKQDVINGVYSVRASASGFIAEIEGFSIVTSDVIVDIVMALATRNLTIIVEGKETPLGGYVLQENAQVRKVSPGTTIIEYTDALGSAVFALVPDTYNITVSKSDFNSKAEAVVLGTIDLIHVIQIEKIYLVEYFVISGTFPIQDWTIVLKQSSIIKYSTTTDQNGYAEETGVIVGIYQLEATPPGSGTPLEFRTVTVDSDQEITIISN